MKPKIDLREFISDLCKKLQAQADNAARRGKPTMWAYYLRMLEHVVSTYSDALAKNEDAIVKQAYWVEQEAMRICFVSPDATYSDMALWYAYSVYARKILHAAGRGRRGWVKLWLKPSTEPERA